MKRLSLSVLWAFLLVFVTHAKVVTLEQAQQYATAFMQTQGVRPVQWQILQTRSSGQPAYYVFNLQPQGWIIVAADDVVTPVLGYSRTGSLDWNRIPDNMRFMLDDYEKQIRSLARVVDTPHKAWQSVSSISTRASGGKIDPLITINWNQNNPYNVYCPKQKALVGCVAVAMGQAMSVQQWPPRPKGKVSYTSANYGGLSINFDAERAYNWGDIMSGANNYDEVARFLYHAGMSVRMDYGEDGSGILTSELHLITDGLINHFDYPNTVQHFRREQYEGDWEQLLINELNAGRAIIYNAVDSKAHAGHSFNLDGYDGNGHFHVNWGWGSYGNGNFSIDNLRDAAMGMDYDTQHMVIVGIGAPDQVLKNISLSYNRIEEGLPGGSVVGAIEVNGEAPKAEYEIQVHGTFNPITGQYNAVPFRYENGKLLTTDVLKASDQPWEIEITVKENETKTQLTQGFRIHVEAWKSLEETTRIEYDRVLKKFKLVTKHNVTYMLKTIDGQVLKQGALELPELEWGVSSLSVGEHLLELKCADEVKTIRIISKKQ